MVDKNKSVERNEKSGNYFKITAQAVFIKLLFLRITKHIRLVSKKFNTIQNKINKWSSVRIKLLDVSYGPYMAHE